MDETKRVNFYLPTSHATTEDQTVCAPGLSPDASCSADTLVRRSGVTYLQYDCEAITASNPVGETAANNSNAVHPNRSSSTQPDGTSKTSSSTEFAELKVNNNNHNPHPPSTPPNPASHFPDGGRSAWLVILGSWCVFFITWGPIYTIGNFQRTESTLLPTYSASTIALISSTKIAILYASGLFFSPLFNTHGPRWLLLLGSAMHLYGWMMASFSTHYYQKYLSQVCSALGASCIYYAAAGAITTWFLRRRTMAFGIAATGAGVGGIVIPIMVERLVPRVGNPWTMRIIGFLILGFVVVVNLTVKSRIPHVRKKAAWKRREYLDPLREATFCLLALGMGVFAMGFFLPFCFLVVQAEEKGFSAELAGYLIPVLNAAGIPGLILTTLYAPKLGPFNLTILTTTLCSLITLTLWLPNHSSPVPTIIFALLYGFLSNAYMALAPMLVAQISAVQQIGVRSGVLFLVVGMAALMGLPVGGALIERGEGGWRCLIGFAGGCMGVGAGILLVVREVAVGGGVSRV
ncbi:MAG: hypothetical protein Q9221_004702 [Calogaya cf. arnoldii]